MTQAKPVKKKKISKKEKVKKNEKKMEEPKPLEETNKRSLAENNVREMLLKAHKIHKDYLVRKLSSGKYKPVLADIRENYKDSEESYLNRMTDQRYVSRESLKRNIAITSSTSGNVSDIISVRHIQKSSEVLRPVSKHESVRRQQSADLHFKKSDLSSSSSSSRRSSAEDSVRRNEPIQRRTPTESTVNRKISYRRNSAEYPERKKVEVDMRQSSVGNLHRKKTGNTPGLPSGEFSVRRKEEPFRTGISQEPSQSKVTSSKGKRTKSRTEISRGGVTDMKDHHAGRLSFVSLDALDKTCRNSTTCLSGKKKGILRKKSRPGSTTDNANTPPSSVCSQSKASNGSVKKQKARKSENPRNKEEEPKRPSTKEKKKVINKNKKMSLQEVISKDSDHTSTASGKAKFSNEKSQRKSSSRNLAKASTYRIAGSGDLFSSNTSYSKMSSDSDVSKIDRKFMQILEAVTQSNLIGNLNKKSSKPSRDKVTERKQSEGNSSQSSPKLKHDKNHVQGGERESELTSHEGKVLSKTISVTDPKKTTKNWTSTLYKPNVADSTSEESSDKKEQPEDRVRRSIRTKEEASQAMGKSVVPLEQTTIRELWIKNSSPSEDCSSVSVAINNDTKKQESPTPATMGDTVVAVRATPEKQSKSQDPCKADKRKETEKKQCSDNLKKEQDGKKTTPRKNNEQSSNSIASTVNANIQEGKQNVETQKAETESTKKHVPKIEETESKVPPLKNSSQKSSNEVSEISRDERKPTQPTNAISNYKEIKTWSIIKRLEKAFQTLGLDLKDLESSDDDSSASEKIQISVGGNNLKTQAKRETSKRKEQTSLVEKAPKSDQRKSTNLKPSSQNEVDGDKFGIESNGSGDKNMNTRRTKRQRKAEESKPSNEKENHKIHVTPSTYHAAVMHNKRMHAQKKTKDMESYEMEGLSQGDLVLCASVLKKKRNTENSGQTLMAESRELINEKFRTLLLNEELAKFAGRLNSHTGDDGREYTGRRQSRKSRKSHLDDINVDNKASRSCKRKSDHSLSASCSCSSLSEVDQCTRHKKKKNFNTRRWKCRESLPMDASDEESWMINLNGIGDAAASVTRAPSLEIVAPDTNGSEEIKDTVDMKTEKFSKNLDIEISELNVLNKVSASPNYGIFKMEKENNELELKHLRERHKQIISEIKTSLDEIRKQHNLYTKLQKQTKRFNRDCHTKRRLLASYLKDVEEHYERRKNRMSEQKTQLKNRSKIRPSRTVSSDRCNYGIWNTGSTTDKLNEYHLRTISLKRKLRRDANYCLRGRYELNDSAMSMVHLSQELSSVTDFEDINRIESTELLSSDITEDAESFRSVTSSPQVNYAKRKESKDDEKMMVSRAKSDVVVEKKKIFGSMEMLCLEWGQLRDNNQNRETIVPSENSVKEVPSYLSHFLKKLNNIIVQEKNQLEDLVVKVSGSSHSAFPSRAKGTASTNSVASDSTLYQQYSVGKRTAAEYRAFSTSYKCSLTSLAVGGPKPYRPKCQCKDGLEKPTVLTNPIHVITPDTLKQEETGECDQEITIDPEDSIIHNEPHPSGEQYPKSTEEVSFRNGDPSFDLNRYFLNEPHKKSDEDEAHRRKFELERYLHKDKPVGSQCVRGGSCHVVLNATLADMPCCTMQRHQSFMIDHKKEDKEENQRVSGNESPNAASHNILDRNILVHEYYLAAEKEIESRLEAYRRTQEHPCICCQTDNDHSLDGTKMFWDKCVEIDSETMKSKDAFCQTDNNDFEDSTDIYLMDEYTSTPSIL